MTMKPISIFLNETYTEPAQKVCPTNKTDVYHFHAICSLDKIDLKDYGLENNRGYTYVLVVIDKFSKFGWTIPLKSKNAQTKKNLSRN